MKSAIAVCLLLAGPGAANGAANAANSAAQELQRLQAFSGSPKILGELAVAERAVARELRGHPEVLQEEERLLHEASAMARKAGHAEARAKGLKKAAKKAAKKAKHAKASLGQQNAQRSLQAVTGKIQQELGVAERELAMALHGHPEILNTEERLLHQASEMARRAGQEHTPQQKAPAAPSAAAPMAFALAERKLAHNDLEVAKEAKGLEVMAARAIAAEDPVGAARVANLLDKISREQVSLARKEASSAHAVQSSLKLAHVPAAAPREMPHLAAPAAAPVESMANLVATEDQLVGDDRRTLAELRFARTEARQALRALSPAKEAEVSKLLKMAETSQLHVAQSEFAEAMHDHRSLAESAHGAKRSLRRAGHRHHKAGPKSFSKVADFLRKAELALQKVERAEDAAARKRV